MFTDKFIFSCVRLMCLTMVRSHWCPLGKCWCQVTVNNQSFAVSNSSRFSVTLQPSKYNLHGSTINVHTCIDCNSGNNSHHRAQKISAVQHNCMVAEY